MKGNSICIPKKVNMVNKDPIKIEKDNNNYCLNIGVNEDIIRFSIIDKENLLSVNYIKTMSFQEIKGLNKIFLGLSSFNDFYEYLQALSVNQKINIEKGEEKISLILLAEYLSKPEIIKINLSKGKIDLNLNIKNICEELLSMKEKIKDIDILKSENKELKEKQNKEIDSLKEKLNENETVINRLKGDVEKQKKEMSILNEKLNENEKVIKRLRKMVLEEAESGYTASNKKRNDNHFYFNNDRNNDSQNIESIRQSLTENEKEEKEDKEKEKEQEKVEINNNNVENDNHGDEKTENENKNDMNDEEKKIEIMKDILINNFREKYGKKNTFTHVNKNEFLFDNKYKIFVDVDLDQNNEITIDIDNNKYNLEQFISVYCKDKEDNIKKETFVYTKKRTPQQTRINSELKQNNNKEEENIVEHKRKRKRRIDDDDSEEENNEKKEDKE